MVQSQFSLSWDSYKSNVCSGFSALQQNGEFVDMTLAADGHLVKVHQVLVALSSPYLKELITSAPCQHPVIFLNNVSHRTLCYLLEYIYTGEVLVPADNLSAFADAASSLHIKGLENINSNNNHAVKMAINVSPTDSSELCPVSGIKRKAAPCAEDIEQIGLPPGARKILVKHEHNSHMSMKDTSDFTKEEYQDYNTDMDDNAHDSDDEFRPDATSFTTKENASICKANPSSNLQFTVSIRGSLQVILNRYIYNLHSTTTRTGVRRWRCVDYRNNKCTAFVVTKGNIVLNRANLHNHAFHDKKILSKIEKKAVYSALDEVEKYKEMASKEDSTDNENFMLLEDFSKDMNDKTTR